MNKYKLLHFKKISEWNWLDMLFDYSNFYLIHNPEK